MVIRSYRDLTPRIHRSVYVDGSAIVIGDVVLEEDVSVWPGAILRADDDRVTVRKGTAVMDASFAEAPQGSPVEVGRGCLISHGARLHGCTVNDGALVGVGAIVLDGAVIGEGAIVGAGSVVTPGSAIEPRSLALGSPARTVRPATDDEVAWIARETIAMKAKAKEYGNASKDVD